MTDVTDVFVIDPQDAEFESATADVELASLRRQLDRAQASASNREAVCGGQDQHVPSAAQESESPAERGTEPDSDELLTAEGALPVAADDDSRLPTSSAADAELGSHSASTLTAEDDSAKVKLLQHAALEIVLMLCFKSVE